MSVKTVTLSQKVATGTAYAYLMHSFCERIGVDNYLLDSFRPITRQRLLQGSLALSPCLVALTFKQYLRSFSGSTEAADAYKNYLTQRKLSDTIESLW